MTKIVTRLIVLGILTTLCIAVMIFSVILINERSLKDGYIINIAGKERMLTQKITKEIFIINSQNSKDYTALNQAIIEFEQNLHTLRFGDSKRDIAPPNKEILKTKLDSVSKKWQSFKADVESFKQASSKLHNDREFLYANNLTMLKLSDKIVKAMVQANLPAKQIDDSGRQRMLTQRMTYLLVRYINNWEDYAYRGFKESYALYNSIIDEFAHNQNYKKIPHLSQSIQEAYAFWQVYSKHINAVLETQEIVIASLRKIAQNNTDILSEIDWLVNLYSDISIHSRTYLAKFQYAAACIMLLLAFYSIYHLLKIHGILKRFVDTTQLLASGKLKTNLAQAIKLEGESELSQASYNLSRFIQQIERTKETSNQAIYLSEVISEEVASISDAIRNKLTHAHISDSKRKNIENAINLGEDIAIQSSEQLIVAAKLIEKLHIILKEIEDCCDTSKS
ncbi:type IV pili methyl-accepting chemotaxis transducer N-terminal domain-containing protein [Helicobacter turcicus]|uniref:Type IV pili methyl-accepting chemotaxis transducer N-terminal domain-containing protein n=1 Tax=Helicobacter turcicus TaxID=2867412 RepID=A0ABS7JND6_9HELI|nr:type IV pili methyl-accepting chemotaxis transducer N-terminal domain-containing protein [Helicobacter turcicus]MBX7490916.1 type IV pili methyl-accepting chemotaxis transducer N-terminal domain-containing protein [Helicobacter turcicus]MBX7545770.1 type IV pili methyl-accepting chemotaxis transducer N-terminal domain-containing protein [Helicobacter turcicus]